VSGPHRLSRQNARKFPSRHDSEFTFGLFALALLAMLAIGLTLLAPSGSQLEPILQFAL
jgi:hypothetical protein